MAKRIGGARRKTRQKLSKPRTLKGKISLTNYFAEYKPGQRVAFVFEPAIHAGLGYARRFTGHSGTIIEKKGSCYAVAVDDKGKHKTFFIHPVHLKRL